MEMDKQIGLVLEGGGMRGVFTCGVLDWLLDHRIDFPYTVAVSAGACNGLSYMSHQRGRAKYSNIDMLEKYKYIGLKYLWTQHSILDQDLLYKEFPERLVPYDFEAYKANPGVFEMVTTNCLTGLPNYLSEKQDPRRLVRIAKASSSLPYVCPVVIVDRMPMLDGGIVDVRWRRGMPATWWCSRATAATGRPRGTYGSPASFIVASPGCGWRSAIVVNATTASWKWWNGWKMKEKSWWCAR